MSPPLHLYQRDWVAMASGAGVYSVNLPIQLCLVPISTISTMHSDTPSIDSEACGPPWGERRCRTG